MQERRSYHLKEGAVLDDRYAVGAVLGEGGFGITYEAVNTHNGARVAIKEYYLRDAMYRDTTNEGSAVHCRTEADLPAIIGEKKRFLKEARILSDFAGMPGIVQVVDHFEENDTAYLVMELLEGKTLKAALLETGRMEGSVVFQLFIPVIRTLMRIHEAGVIHRDISPDNIMLRPDGSLVLMDFGAVRDIRDDGVSHSLIYKNGYSAKEQFDRHGRLGPWTDVYSLCATMYACVTGTAPEDAFQRVLFDELKAPSELGISLKKGAEEILMKGLSLPIERRWQNMAELLGAVLAIFPEIDPVREAERKRKRRRRAAAALVAAAAALIFGLFYYRTHEAEIHLRNVETLTTWLTRPEGLSDDEYERTAALIRGRVETLAGKKHYLWNGNADRIAYTIPLSCYQDYDPEYITKMYISRPTAVTFQSGDREIEVAASREDLESVELRLGEVPEVSRLRYGLPETGDYAYLAVTLSSRAVEELGEDLTVPGTCIYMALDSEELTNYYYWSCFAAGDGRTVYIVSDAMQGALGELFAYDLNQEPTAEAMLVVTEPKARWENPETSLSAGEYQVLDSYFDNQETVLLTYETGIKGNGDWNSALAVFKARLDAIGQPYAFGVSAFDSRTILVRMDADSICRAEAETLGASTSLGIYSRWDGYVASIYSTGISASEETNWETHDRIEYAENDGAPVLEVYCGSYDAERLEEKLTALREDGETEIYLSLGSSKRVAAIGIEEALEELEGRKLCFERFTVGGASYEVRRALAQYLCIYNAEQPSKSSSLSKTRFFRADGTPDGERDALLFSFFDEQAEAAAEIEEALDAAVLEESSSYSEVSCFFEQASGGLRIILDGFFLPNFPQNALAATREIIEEYDLDAGTFPSVQITLWPRVHSGAVGALSMFLSRDDENGRMSYRLYANEALTAAQWNRAVDYLRSDEYFAGRSEYELEYR